MLVPKQYFENDLLAHDELEAFVQSALDALSAHVAVLDQLGVIISVNRAWRQFARVNGFQDARDGIGTNYLAVCDRATNNQYANQVAHGIREIIAGAQDEFHLEYPCHSPSKKRWFVVRISKFDWYGDMRVIVAHQDVTDLKQAELDLAETQERTQAIIDHVSNGIIVFTPQGIIETANPATANIFDYTITQLVGMHIQDIIPAIIADNGNVETQSEIAHEFVGCRANGDTFPVACSINPFVVNHQALYTAIIRDITLEKQIATEILEKERIVVALEKERELRELKNRFLSMMSHELRTPLTSIQLSSDMLSQYGEQASENERFSYLENIQEQTKRLTALVSDVLTLSRAEDKTFNYEPEKLDYITFCRNIIEEFQLTHHQTHSLLFDSPIAESLLIADPRLLRHALTNLLSNAIKYSPAKSVIDIRIELKENQLLTSIRDSGIGIPQQDINRLFDAFHRAENVEEIPGTGLGLAITRHAIETHGGHIAVESELGLGTKFTFSLPIQMELKKSE